MENSSPIRVLRERAVCSLLGNIHRVTLWKWEKAGEFPKRIRLGKRAVGWLESDVARFIDQRAAGERGVRSRAA
jgi:prophage regulatory protein